MKNGVRITRKTDQGTVSLFYPEEIIQQEQLNRRIERNLAAQHKAAADEQARNAEIARREAAHARRINKTIRSCIRLVAIGTVAWLAVPLGLMAAEMALVVSLPCLCGVAYKIGTIK